MTLKTRIVILLTCVLAILSTRAFAGNHHFIHLEPKDKATRNVIATMIHIDQVIENSVYAVVDDRELALIKKHFSKILAETHPITLRGDKGAPSDEIDFPRKDEKFHTYQETLSLMDELARTYPNLVTRFSFGTSVEGRSIPAVRITGSKNTSKDAFIPGILFVGSHHAREHLSTEVPLLIMKHLLAQYSSNERIKNLIDSRDIYFAPMINPDGAMHDIKGRRYKSWRKNRVQNAGGSFGVDLNRNYSFGWGTGGSSRNESSNVYMGPKPFSEPETQAVKSFIESHANIRILLSFHTFSELILYPWGGKSTGIGGRDEKVFQTMAQKMATWNHYTPEQASDLYIASGDTCDWAYGEHNIFCFTFELSPKSMWNGGFYPGAGMIDKAFEANLQPAIYLIEKAVNPYGVL